MDTVLAKFFTPVGVESQVLHDKAHDLVSVGPENGVVDVHAHIHGARCNRECVTYRNAGVHVVESSEDGS